MLHWNKIDVIDTCIWFIFEFQEYKKCQNFQFCVLRKTRMALLQSLYWSIFCWHFAPEVSSLCFSTDTFIWGWSMHTIRIDYPEPFTKVMSYFQFHCINNINLAPFACPIFMANILLFPHALRACRWVWFTNWTYGLVAIVLYDRT